MKKTIFAFTFFFSIFATVKAQTNSVVDKVDKIVPNQVGVYHVRSENNIGIDSPDVVLVKRNGAIIGEAFVLGTDEKGFTVSMKGASEAKIGDVVCLVKREGELEGSNPDLVVATFIEFVNAGQLKEAAVLCQVNESQLTRSQIANLSKMLQGRNVLQWEERGRATWSSKKYGIMTDAWVPFLPG